MSLQKPYLDVPGTTIFDAEQSRKGYHLNQFCMSLMKAENRTRFKANERAYLDEWPMTEDQKLAVLARESGIDGVVCSPHEVSLIRESVGKDLVIVTPGIRPKGSAKGDQARVTTPLEALRLGVDYIVVGRPITEAASPRDAARAIVDELSRG